MCKPVYETCEREVCYTVCKPVCCTKTIKVLRRTLGNPRCLLHTDPCNALLPVHLPVPRVGARKFARSRVECISYVRETCVKKVPYTVCKMVPEQRVKTCTYQVCHMVRDLREADPLHGVPDGARAARQDLQLPVCHMVAEQHVKTCCYTVCHMVPEQRVKTCTYKVCHMVPEQRGADLHLHGVPHGARAAREDLHATRCARWCRSSV